MINNLALIKTLIDFPDEDTFYKVEIIQRRKDNPDLPSNTKLIKTYFINDPEKRLEMGKASRKLAIEKFSNEIVNNGIYTVYQKALS